MADGRLRRVLIFAALPVLWFVLVAADNGPAMYSDRANRFEFPEADARFVRLLLGPGSGNTQACIDELEVYGPEGKDNLALAASGAKASASSCIRGHAQHAIEHLNDGEYGNARSWIPAGVTGEWAQIELPQAARVSSIVISRDRMRQYGDRIPNVFDIQISTDGENWQTVRRVEARAMSGAVAGSSGRGEPALPAPPPPPQTGGGSETPIPEDLSAPASDALGFENLALRPQAKASASSVYADGGLPIHQIAHLNDGKLGNSNSWISKGEPSWAEIDLGTACWVWKVAFGSDSSARYRDRAPAMFTIQATTDAPAPGTEAHWQTAWRHSGPAVNLRREFRFRPVHARRVRVAIQSASGGEARIDELEVYGQEAPIAVERLGPLPEPEPDVPGIAVESLLRMAFVAEEHAWLKTFGRADLDPSLVPYNGRVTEYPRHVGDDRLPLPPLPSAPVLDGRLDDACWDWASRGMVRVASADDFDAGPLVEVAAHAGRLGDDLVLAIQASRLLSTHIAVISAANWEGCGIIVITREGLVFNQYSEDEPGRFKIEKSMPLESAQDLDAGVFEMCLPLALFPDAEALGLRIGLGIGGRHTSPRGRPIHFTFSSLGIAQQGNCETGAFQVRLSLPQNAASGTATLSPFGGTVPLEPGQTRVVNIPAQSGPIGRQFELKVSEAGVGSYTLHLFRYDPLERTLALMADLADRLERKGLDVVSERERLNAFRKLQSALAAAPPNLKAQRAAFLEARLAKRRLFFRERELAPLESLLFVKRHAFHPSHIYTDYTDAPFRPGGGIYRLDIPRTGDRLDPEAATLTRLFDAGAGIARDPAATFDLSRIYFGYRPTSDGFYHIRSMDADGGNLSEITHGPYHDFYPCPLPDGGVAFISTRCTARVFCFRGGSSVLFRMDPDGGNMRPLSYASLSEWAPSVMRDGRIIWTRWEYIDKGADFSQTLWSIRPDGSHPELVFGNTIIQPNGYASGREVPGTSEICCTLVSHFGDINGPIALIDPREGRFNPKAIRSITPEVPWPGMWPSNECFRDPLPIARDYFLCAHAPRDRFGLAVIDRFGNREMLYLDPAIDSMGATLFRRETPPPTIPDNVLPSEDEGEFALMDVYRGLTPAVERGAVKWLRVVEEVRHDIALNPNRDHTDFMKWYASPVDLVSGPYGWPTYVAKTPLGLVPVAEDGSARFKAPAGKTVYFQALDADYNELQRMRSIVQLQPGEVRSCIGCHESRTAAPQVKRSSAVTGAASRLAPPSWGPGPFSYEKVVQPVLDARCVRCHKPDSESRIDLTGTLDANRVPASYRTLITKGLVHYVDCGWNSGGCEKREPLTFGTLKSTLWQVLGDEHHGVTLTQEEKLRIKTWTDLNCPLWPDYQFRDDRVATIQ